MLSNSCRHNAVEFDVALKEKGRTIEDFFDYALSYAADIDSFLAPTSFAGRCPYTKDTDTPPWPMIQDFWGSAVMVTVGKKVAGKTGVKVGIFTWIFAVPRRCDKQQCDRSAACRSVNTSDACTRAAQVGPPARGSSHP